jgi:hypothetical protein
MSRELCGGFLGKDTSVHQRCTLNGEVELNPQLKGWLPNGNSLTGLKPASRLRPIRSNLINEKKLSTKSWRGEPAPIDRNISRKGATRAKERNVSELGVLARDLS